MSLSIFSYKGQYTWRLQTSDLYEGKEVVIDWRKFLPENIGSKYERSRLIVNSKKFLLLKVDQPVRKWRRKISAASIFNWYKQLNIFVRWMTMRGVWKFSDVAPHDLLEFFKSIKSRHSDLPPTRKSVGVYVDLIKDLWFFRNYYQDGLRVNLSEYEDDIWQECNVRENTPWRAPDEDFSLPLIADSLEWIRNYGGFFIKSQKKIYSEQKRWVGLTRAKKSKLSKKLFSQICTDPIYEEIAFKAGCNAGAPGVARAFTVTIGAAINVLLFTVGQRVSELTRLDIDCVKIFQSEFGQSVPCLRGVAAKKDGLHREWIAADPIPEVVRWLEDLYENARTESGLKALFITRSSGSAIPLPGRKLRRMTSASPVTAMNAFANAPFRADRPRTARLHPHAARKAFAAFVVRRDKTALEALSLHFGHVYRAFTDGSYAGNLTLQMLLSEADRDALGGALTELLTSKHVSGRAALAVAQYKKNAARFRGKLLLQKSVDQLISQGIQVAPCNWGYCLYAQPTSACGGDKRGPNELQRSPDVCAGCTNFVATNVHTAWWNARVQRDEVFLLDEGVPSQTKEIVGRRLEKSRGILRRLLGVKDAQYEKPEEK